MDRFILLAHAGEKHETATEGFMHTLANSWYSVPMVVLLIILILMLVNVVTKGSLTATIITAQFLLLVGGILLFQLMPVLSMLFIVVGFALSLFVVINGLRNDTHENKAD